MSAAPLPSGEPLFDVEQQTDDSYHNTRILATAVISLAMAIALIFFLHMYLRYFLYRRRLNGRRSASGRNIFRFLVTSSAAAAVEQPSGGLEPAAIAALPTFSYRKSAAGRDAGDGEGDEGGGAECAVCLSAVEEGETVRMLPKCKHTFHVGCIDMWFGSHSTCPVCRAVVEPPPSPSSSSSSGVVHAGESPATGHPRVTQEHAPRDGGASQEGASGSKEAANSASAPALRLSSSFRRMLSWERSSSGRRVQADVAGDLERQ